MRLGYVVSMALLVVSLQTRAACESLPRAWLDAALPLPKQLPQESPRQLYYSDFRSVQDGDSIRLQGGDRVRMRYINSLELGRSKSPDQPLAQTARAYVIKYLHGSRVYLKFGMQQKDSYGRLLASVYSSRGHWVAPALVARGLAYVVSIPPAVAPACLWQLENDARTAGLGLWDLAISDPIVSETINPLVSGFMRVRGKVVSVTPEQNAWYVDLAGNLVIKVPRENSKFFTKGFFSNLDGRVLTIRGWLTWRKLTASQQQRGYRPAVMILRHPHMFETIQ
jgi:endonuclease YncB( thermonuclease family)